MGTPPRAEAVTVLAEARVDQRLQHLQQRLLNQPVRRRRDAKLALASAGLRDRYPAYRRWPVPALQQSFADRRPLGLEQRGRLVNVQSVHARRALVGPHPLPRSLQVLSRQRCLQQHRPRAPVFMARASGFVASGLARGFTARSPRPPGSHRHLTHDPRHRHVLKHSLAFGPSSRDGDYYGLG